MTKPSRRSIAATIFAVLCLQSQVARSQQQMTPFTPPMVYEGGEKHPVIHRAIRALEAAKAYVEGAPHDFCGHRDLALTESNLALNHLGLAIICDKRRDKSVPPRVEMARPSSVTSLTGPAPEKHPLIRQAMNALQAARRDLNSASHDYCGHRVEALEAVNRVLTQLKLASDCDKD